MMHRSLHRIAPTLLALGLLPAAAWGAAAGATGPSGTERDAHLEAVLGLVEGEYRLPAQRQIADFQKAAYVEAEWHGKFLTWYHADRFRTLVLDKAEQASLAAVAKALEAELKAAAKNGKLPKQLADKLTGSGVVYRLVNDLLRVVGQDQVPETMGLVAERKASLDATTQALIAATNANIEAALAAVKANAKAEDEGLALEDNNPKFIKMAQEAVELRLEAVRSTYFAVKVLREVSERGKDFGLDDAPARAFLKDFATRNFALLQDWDYAWGDYHPYLRALTLDLAAQGARFGAKGANPDDVAADLRKVLDLDLSVYAKEPAVAEEIRTLQAKSWGNYIAWCREMGRDVAPKWYQKGQEAFREFKDKSRSDRHFRLDHPTTERAAEVARVYFQAGRLLQAKNDPSAAAAFGAVAAVRSNPLAGNAMRMQSYRPGGSAAAEGAGAAGAAWGAQPIAEDPAGAVLMGNAMLRQANASGDAAQRRSSLVAAAVALRNGVLGLASASHAEGADEAAPELWFRYAESLSKLGMRWHAALVAQSGLRHIETRTKELKGKSPWRDKNGKWTTSGRFVSLLAKNAVTYASNLQAAGRGPAVTQIYDDSITLVNTVSPEDGGKALDRIQIIIAIQEGDFKRALELTETYGTKYPEEYYDTASMRTHVFSTWLNKLKKPEERKPIAEKAKKEAKETADRAKVDLPGAKDPARKRVLNQALRDGQALEAVIALSDGEDLKVLDMLDAEYWKNAPSDQDKAAQMLGYMCQALRQWYQAQVKDPAKGADAALLVASWPRVQTVYEVWKTQKARLGTQEEKTTRQGVQIAYVFNVIANFQIPAMRGQPGAPAQLGEIQKAAARAYADLIEPTVTAASKPELMLQVGNVLWELDEHTRACRLFELYLKSVGTDPALAALRDTPKEVLAPLDGPIRARPELRAKWEEVVDLLYDDPGLHQRILDGLEEKDWRERKRDYVRAIEAIRAVRADAAKARMSLGADFATIDEGLARLDGQVQQLGRDLSVSAKLALGYREQGDKAKANALYEKLIAYDPTKPEYLSAKVELTIDEYKETGKVSEEVLKATQIKAAKVRSDSQNGTPVYWTAVIQVMELALALKDPKLVNDRLRFDAVNQSTPADDLQARPRERRDDKRVRRAGNALTVDLCRRYLAIFSQPGVTIPPSFAISEVEIDGKPTQIYLPVEAPKFAPVRRELDDGTVVHFLWEEGKEPPPEPEAAPTPVAVPEAVPVPAAPAPAPEAKP
jgi:hypothetical protein